MISPEYVTAEEVARVCAEIGMDDWSKRTESVVSTKEQREAESFEKEVPIQSISIFEVYHQVFRNHKSGYP
jgi:hypothetical protein